MSDFPEKSVSKVGGCQISREKTLEWPLMYIVYVGQINDNSDSAAG